MAWSWSNQGAPPGLTIPDGPLATVGYIDNMYAFVQASDGHLWVNWWNGNSWQWADQGTPPGLFIPANGPASIAATTDENSQLYNMYAFAPGSDGNLWVNWWAGSPPGQIQ
jgi:hypothetical protein